MREKVQAFITVDLFQLKTPTFSMCALILVHSYFLSQFSLINFLWFSHWNNLQHDSVFELCRISSSLKNNITVVNWIRSQFYIYSFSLFCGYFPTQLDLVIITALSYWLWEHIFASFLRKKERDVYLESLANIISGTTFSILWCHLKKQLEAYKVGH